MVTEQVSETEIAAQPHTLQRQTRQTVQALWQRVSSLSWQQTLGVMGALTLITLNLGSGAALAGEAQARATVISATSSPSQHLTQDPSAGLSEGLYLYGDSAQAGVIGKSYWVFQVTGNRQVIGAVYAPYSSFDCFHGQERAMQLELMVRDSYSQNHFPTSVPLGTLKSVGTLSATDQNLLKTCQGLVQGQTADNHAIQR